MPACSSRLRRVAATLAIAASAHATLATTTLPALAQARGARPPAAQPAGSLVERGRALYDDQQYEESIQTLSAALLRPGASEADRVETYRLLAYNFIVLGRKEEAEAAVRGLFSLQPDFKLPKGESPRFRDFFAEVRAKWESEGRPGLVAAEKAAPKPVRIEHVSPAEAKKDAEIVLRGRVDDPEGRVDSVRVFYRTGSTAKPVELPATLSNGEFRASIPPSAVQPPLVEYWLEALDKGRLPIAGRGDAGAPLRIVVAAPAAGLFASPWFWTGAGAVVVGGIATALLLSKKSSDSGGGAGPGGGGGGGGGATSHVTITVGP